MSSSSASLVVCAQTGRRVVFVRHDVERDCDPLRPRGNGDALVQRSVQLLLMATHKLRRGLDQGVEGIDVQRFGIFLVTPHGPRADQRRLGLAVFDHGDSPAVIVFILEHARGPAVALPKPGLLDFRRLVRREVGAGAGLQVAGIVQCSITQVKNHAERAATTGTRPTPSSSGAQILVFLLTGYRQGGRSAMTQR